MSSYFELTDEQTFDPATIVTDCIERGEAAILLDAKALPAEFFDLSSGLAGELPHKLTTYRMRLAGVVPDVTVHSERFQEFAREANRGAQFRFFPDWRSATEWLTAE